MGLLSQPDWKPWRNDSEVLVPAHGLFRASEVVIRKLDGVPLLKGVKPFCCPMRHLWVNSPVDVEPGKYGACTQAEILYVKFDRADAEAEEEGGSDQPPLAGEPWGVKAGGLLLRRGYGGFVVLQSPIENTSDLVLVRRVEHHTYQGELADDLDAPADATEAWEDPPVADFNIFSRSVRADDEVRLFAQSGFVAKDCVNRDPTMDAPEGTYGQVAWVEGEWTWQWMACAG